MNIKVTAERLKSLGQEFEACYNDINGFRTTLQTAIDAMPYKSEQAAPAFRQAMHAWDGEFDSVCKHLVTMRDILVPQADRAILTEENNTSTAYFFESYGKQYD